MQEFLNRVVLHQPTPLSSSKSKLSPLPIKYLCPKSQIPASLCHYKQQGRLPTIMKQKKHSLFALLKSVCDSQFCILATT